MINLIILSECIVEANCLGFCFCHLGSSTLKLSSPVIFVLCSQEGLAHLCCQIPLAPIHTAEWQGS